MAVKIAWNWVWLQFDSRITRWFEERYADAAGKALRRGIRAAARKLLIALWWYPKFGEVPEGAVHNG